MTGIDSPTEGSQTYFESIEELFVRLRGAPLLLSPTDWHIAREWLEAGIPLDLVQQTLEAVFERRKERGARGRIQSLRYCAEAVWRAWDELQELSAGGVRRPAVVMDVKRRLSALAESLPEGLPQRARWAEGIEALTGSSNEVEESLVELECELLVAAEKSLGSSDRELLGSRVDETLAGLRDRLPEEEIESARDRFWRRALRELTHLPHLSLFSPEAMSGELDPPTQSRKAPDPTEV